ncbi:hypothetical protein BH09MYX1_BH09MYX1_16740 [soil metagenome]
MGFVHRRWFLAVAGLGIFALGCSGCSDDTATPDANDSGVTLDGSTVGPDGSTPADGSTATDGSQAGDATSNVDAGTTTGTPAVIAGCTILPPNHIFNTKISGLPVHPSSAAFIATIGGSTHLHLDLGATVNSSSLSYYGIPYNVVSGNTMTWSSVAYTTDSPDYTWNPKDESDCASGSAHTKVAPCTTANAPSPLLPIPAAPLVEGGIYTSALVNDGDHHILMLDKDKCWLWESYHSYKSNTGWNIFGSAVFDLSSNALRPATWTSADAAGFPILPLILRADEASTGKITHALRFTMTSSKIRAEYTWPARHKTGKTTSQNSPPMGQLFRIKASYVIPSGYTTQAKAILQAMKDYGMYIADGGMNWFVTGEPNAGWTDQTISDVQNVTGSTFEAVDLAPIRNRSGFDANSGAVPP